MGFQRLFFEWSMVCFECLVLSKLLLLSCSLVALTWSLHSRAEYFHACSMCTLVKDFQKHSGLTKLCSYWTHKVFSLCLQWELSEQGLVLLEIPCQLTVQVEQMLWAWRIACFMVKAVFWKTVEETDIKGNFSVAWQVAWSRSVVQGVGKTAQCN